MLFHLLRSASNFNFSYIQGGHLANESCIDCTLMSSYMYIFNTMHSDGNCVFKEPKIKQSFYVG